MRPHDYRKGAVLGDHVDLEHVELAVRQPLPRFVEELADLRMRTGSRERRAEEMEMS